MRLPDLGPHGPQRLVLLGFAGGMLVVSTFQAASAIDATKAERRSLLADLPPAVLESLVHGETALPDNPADLLERVFESATPYVFDVGTTVVQTDSRWFTTQPALTEGAPLLVLRRWPGDTVLALYALQGALTEAGGEPPVGEPAAFGAAGTVAGWSEWTGSLETEAGTIEAWWLERAVADAPTYMGALLIPGDAGLGPGSGVGLMAELRAVLQRVQVRYTNWKLEPAIPRGGPLVLPEGAGSTGADDENAAPWQVARGSGFTIGMPPGFRARRMDGSVPPPTEIPGGLLWLRGRFIDTEGNTVQVGDGRRAGYVAHLKTVMPEWVAGKQPPLGAPAASSESGQSFKLLAERTGAGTARAERWKEPGFAGDWLLFRMRFDQEGFEVGLPVVEGRRSPSLFWIPTTWRPSNRSPAPPPVDPAERFGIKFEQLTLAGRSSLPWAEGYLTVPGLRAELPKGWWPSASLRSSAGYPVRLVDQGGRSLGILTRLEADETLEVSEEGSEWVAQRRPGKHRSAALYRREDGSYLYVAKEGHAFLFRPLEDQAEAETWKRMMQSIQLLRSGR